MGKKQFDIYLSCSDPHNMCNIEKDGKGVGGYAYQYKGWFGTVSPSTTRRNHGHALKPYFCVSTITSPCVRHSLQWILWRTRSKKSKRIFVIKTLTAQHELFGKRTVARHSYTK